MLYAVVDEKNQIVHGPMQWSRGSFTRFFFENDVRVTMPLNPVSETTEVEKFKVMLVEEPTYPEMEYPYEQLAGPYWSVGKDRITGSYGKAPVEMHTIKGKLKEKVSELRFEAEAAGIDYNLNGEIVRLETARGARETLIMKQVSATTGTSYNFKFNIGFRAVTNTELKRLVAAVSGYIQSVYDWEKDLFDLIDAAETERDLKTIEIKSPLVKETTSPIMNLDTPVVGE